MAEFKQGDLVVYMNGRVVQLGRVKSVTEHGVFVYYHEGNTASSTSLDKLFKVDNAYCVQQDSLGGQQVGGPGSCKGSIGRGGCL